MTVKKTVINYSCVSMCLMDFLHVYCANLIMASADYHLGADK